MNLKMEKFNFKTLKNLNYEKQKEYITKYFIPLSNGGHLMRDDDDIKNFDKTTLDQVYLNRVDDKIKKYYYKEFTGIKEPVFKVGKPFLSDDNDEINLCPPLPEYIEYSKHSKKARDGVEYFLNYIKEILADHNEDIYRHILKWLSVVAKGGKNDCALVLKSWLKGAGKSTLHDMLFDYTLNNKMCLETGSEPLKNKFNNILGGKSLVVFEELETFTKSEWSGVDSVLKRQITSKRITLQRKGEDAYETENLNNYMLLSNFDMNDDDRRYFVLPIQTHRIGDTVYWNKLRDTCFNKEVGSAFYAYLREIDTTNYKAQQYPTTKSKLNSISKRLDTVYKFLKEEYLLKNESVFEKVNDFYVIFKAYCSTNNKTCVCKTDFISKLSEIQINFYKTKGSNYFKIEHSLLKTIADKFKWVNELDEFDNEEMNDDIENPKFETDKIDKKDEIIDKQNKQIEELKKELLEIKQELEKRNEKRKAKKMKKIKKIEEINKPENKKVEEEEIKQPVYKFNTFKKVEEVKKAEEDEEVKKAAEVEEDIYLTDSDDDEIEETKPIKNKYKTYDNITDLKDDLDFFLN
jgi:hypothetical protein